MSTPPPYPSLKPLQEKLPKLQPEKFFLICTWIALMMKAKNMDHTVIAVAKIIFFVDHILPEAYNFCDMLLT